MKPLRVLALALSFAAIGPAAPSFAQPAQAADPLAAKVKTDREIRYVREVDAPPERVFELWTTPAGVARFLAPEGRIEARQGGMYEILFDPKNDPEGRLLGTKDAKILKFEPSRFLAFEWRGPAGMNEMNSMPFPTWVELTLEPLPDRPGSTRVTLVHHGFGKGGGWDNSHAFFANAWNNVLTVLAGVCAAERPSAPGS